MSASDATTLTRVGDDAPAAAAPTKSIPSPLINANGSLVPCSCQYAAVCAQAGGQTACSSYWYLAWTSTSAKFSIRTPDGRIKNDVKEKTPGSVLHARTIQRPILPGEHLMCSSCYQKKRFDSAAQKVHHAVPALATAWVRSSHCGVRTVRATGGGRGGVRQQQRQCRGGGSSSSSSSRSDEHGGAAAVSCRQ
jgi:hypothetical protein